MIYSIDRTSNNYHPEVFLEEYKYAVKEKKIPDYITNGKEIYSDDSDEENSDEEYFNKKN